MATGPRFYMPKATALDAIGVTVPGALLNFYLTGSSTRTPTFANETLLVANTNPVEANAAGVFPDIFLNPNIVYKVVFTGPDDGIISPVEFWTADPVEEAWNLAETVFFDLPFEFLGDPPTANEIMGIYVAARPQRIFGDFNGIPEGFARAMGACITPPADGNVVVQVLQNNATPVGTMTIIVTTGAFLFETSAGAPIDLDTGEYLVFKAPASPDSAFAGAGWTITGVNT